MNRKAIGLLVVIGALGAGLSPLSARAAVTLTVMPEKILYAPGETVKFTVTLSNGTPESVKGTLGLKVLWEMEDTANLNEQAIVLAPGEGKMLAVEWKASDVLGCEVRAELSDGTNLIATAAEYFNVCPAKDAQRVGIHCGWPDLFSWPGKDYLDTIPQSVTMLRKNYVNIVEKFAWTDTLANLAPQQDVWCGGYWQSKVALQRIVAESHKQGLKALHYLIAYANFAPAGDELVRRHPEWFLYRESGQLWSDCNVKNLDFQRNPDLRAGQFFGIEYGMIAFPDFSRKAPLEYGIRQMIAGKKMFDWDGVRFDGHYMLWQNVSCPGARDIAGKVAIAGKASEPVARANTEYTRRKMAEVYPDFLFMFNASSRDPDIAEICRDGGAPANEPIRVANEVTSQWRVWKAFSKYLVDDVDTARKFGGYAYAFLVPAWHLSPNVDRIQYALLLAAGDHPWFCTPTTPYKTKSNESVQKDYFRFATRFSAVLWGRGIERVKTPEEVVEVSVPQGTIWWRDFVHRRKLANDKQQLVVHLVNEPPTPNIESTTQQLSAPVKDVLIKFKKPVSKVWLATAEPQLTYRLLPVDGGAVKVPEVRAWSMVVAEMEGK